MRIPQSFHPSFVVLSVLIVLSNGVCAEKVSILTNDFRAPDAAIVDMLTAPPPPTPLLHASTGRVALLFNEGVIDMERLTRERLGLAGFRFDPQTGTSGVMALTAKVEILTVADTEDTKAATVWQPRSGALLNYVEFSPDGRYLSALAVGDGPARMLLFDIARGKERKLKMPVNAAWGNPCSWVENDALLCRVTPQEKLPPLPTAHVGPMTIEHQRGEAQTRTYPNLLGNAYEDAQFEHYFTAELARVNVNGKFDRMPELHGLLLSVEPSPGGEYALVTRLLTPYSRLVPARRFPSVVEVWDLQQGKRLYASHTIGFELETDEEETPRRGEWKPGKPVTLGYIEESRNDSGDLERRWMEIEAPFAKPPQEIARVPGTIQRFGWTSAGTPLYMTPIKGGVGVDVYAVFSHGAQKIWSGTTKDLYDNPGRPLRVNGDNGEILEVDGKIFLAGDGLSANGPRPFLDRFDLRSGKTDRLFLAEEGVYEPVLGILDASQPTLVTSRETETESPNLYRVSGKQRQQLTENSDPYPQLANTSRQVINYQRADGVALSGTLYLPAGSREGAKLPTLIWIYPHEFSEQDYAEQIDIRSFRFHRISGPSPLAAVLAGYAVLIYPTVPIVHKKGEMNDGYLPQLVASVEAAADKLVAMGIADPNRIAVGGRSYGAFSAANLLIHSKRFATAVAMSGAYNRTLTPFGFQHEKRSFWEATELYTSISPFFHANEVNAPILLVHGGGDENPGTPPMQARRFFHALVGEGKATRYVELPGEAHHYLGRENILLATAEMIDWLDRILGKDAQAVSVK